MDITIKDEVMEEVPCNLCGCKETKSLYSVKGYSIVQCRHCKLIYVNPRPKQSYVQALYGENICELYTYIPDLENKKWDMLLKSICSYKEGGKLLEVGCATGTFLKKAAAIFEVCGVEVCVEAAEYARKHYNLNIAVGNLENQRFNDASFDVVVASELIEHLHDPTTFIREVARLLKKDGIFILTTGNIKSLTAKIKKNKWWYLDPPYHLYYFSPEILQKYFTSFNLSIIKFSGNMGLNIYNVVDLYPLYTNKKQFFRDIIARFKIGQLSMGSSLSVYARKN
jgi:ubiquinone/menaquinone biosynthesis C-methylase UbiE